MARTRTKGAKAGNIGTVEGRSGMATCTTDPHWIAITPGTALGYFKGARDRSWWVRQRVGNRYVKQRIGTADDGGVKADGEVVLTHKQAVAKAISLQLEERKPQPRHYGDGMTMGKAGKATIRIVSLRIRRIWRGYNENCFHPLMQHSLRCWKISRIEGCWTKRWS